MVSVNERTVIGRIAIFVCVAVFLAVPLWITFQNLSDDRLYAAFEEGGVDPKGVSPTPLQLESVRRAALEMLYVEPYDPAAIEQYLRYALKYRPLYGPNWLDLAELTQREGNLEVSRLSLKNAASLMPTQGEMQWRVAMLSAALGENSIALQALGRFTTSQPQNTLVAYSIANRLADNDGFVIDSLLPDEKASNVLRKSVALRLFRSGLDQENIDLLKAIWDQSDEIRTDEEWSQALASRLLRAGELEFLQDVWTAVVGSSRAPAEIRNGGFENELANHVFGWTVTDVEGAKIEIDKDERFSGRQSLRITFDGTLNINFNHVYQVSPIEQSGRYQIKGYWKGEEVTTRTGVNLELITEVDDEESVAASKPKFGSWDWRPFAVTLLVPEGAEFVRLRIRRRPTDRLDKLQSGSVWFDDVVLERLPDAAHAELDGR